MTKPLRPYSRVYWQARDDDRFAGIWSDDRVLGCWLRLLVAADMAWPASADIYARINRGSLDRLVKAGLVDIQPGGSYRIHGLDRERSERSDSARIAAVIRHTGSPAGMPPDPNGSANGMRPQPMRNAEGMPRQDEPSRDETRRVVRDALPNGNDDAAKRASARQMAYLRGDINEAELAEMKAADAVPVRKTNGGAA